MRYKLTVHYEVTHGRKHRYDKILQHFEDYLNEVPNTQFEGAYIQVIGSAQRKEANKLAQTVLKNEDTSHG